MTMQHEKSEYLNLKDFLTGLLKLYLAPYDTKIKLVFDIYDFDSDKRVTKNDILTIMSYIPIYNQGSVIASEGKFKQEGGDTYNDLN